VGGRGDGGVGGGNGVGSGGVGTWKKVSEMGEGGKIERGGRWTNNGGVRDEMRLGPQN